VYGFTHDSVLIFSFLFSFRVDLGLFSMDGFRLRTGELWQCASHDLDDDFFFLFSFWVWGHLGCIDHGRLGRARGEGVLGCCCFFNRARMLTSVFTSVSRLPFTMEWKMHEHGHEHGHGWKTDGRFQWHEFAYDTPLLPPSSSSALEIELAPYLGSFFYHDIFSY
jgi:hypothetical protein